MTFSTDPLSRPKSPFFLPLDTAQQKQESCFSSQKPQVPSEIREDALRFSLRQKGWIDEKDRVIPGAPFPSLPPVQGIAQSLISFLEELVTLTFTVDDQKRKSIISYLQKKVDKTIGEWQLKEFTKQPIFEEEGIKKHDFQSSYGEVLKELYKTSGSQDARLRGGFLRYLLRQWMLEAVNMLGLGKVDPSIIDKLNKLPADIDVILYVLKMTTHELISSDVIVLDHIAEKLTEDKYQRPCYRALAAHACFKKRAYIADQSGNEFTMFTLEGSKTPDLEVVIAKSLARENLCVLDALSLSLDSYLSGQQDKHSARLLVESVLQGWQAVSDNLCYLLHYDNIETIDSYGVVRHFSHLAMGARASEEGTAKDLWNNLRRITEKETEKGASIQEEVIEQLGRCRENHDHGEAIFHATLIDLLFSMHQNEFSSRTIDAILQAFPIEKADALLSTVIAEAQAKTGSFASIAAAAQLLAFFAYALPADESNIVRTVHEETYWLRIDEKKSYWLLPFDLKMCHDQLKEDPEVVTAAFSALLPFFPVGTKVRNEFDGVDHSPMLERLFSGNPTSAVKYHFLSCCFQMRPTLDCFNDLIALLPDLPKTVVKDVMMRVEETDLLKNSRTFFSKLNLENSNTIASTLPLAFGSQNSPACQTRCLALWKDMGPAEKKEVGIELIKLGSMSRLSPAIRIMREMQREKLLYFEEQCYYLDHIISQCRLRERRYPVFDEVLLLAEAGINMPDVPHKVMTKRTKCRKRINVPSNAKENLIWLIDQSFKLKQELQAISLLQAFVSKKMISSASGKVINLWVRALKYLVDEASSNIDETLEVYDQSDAATKAKSSQKLQRLIVSLCERLISENHSRTDEVVLVAYSLPLDASTRKRLNQAIERVELPQDLATIDKPYFFSLSPKKREPILRVFFDNCASQEGIAYLKRLSPNERTKYALVLLDRCPDEGTVSGDLFKAIVPAADELSDARVIHYSKLYLRSIANSNLVKAFVPRLIKLKENQLALKLCETIGDLEIVMTVAKAAASDPQCAEEVHRQLQSFQLEQEFAKEKEPCEQLIDSLLASQMNQEALFWMKDFKPQTRWINALFRQGCYETVAELLMKTGPLRVETAASVIDSLDHPQAIDLALHYDMTQKCRERLKSLCSSQDAAHRNVIPDYFQRVRGAGIACEPQIYCAVIDEMNASDLTKLYDEIVDLKDKSVKEHYFKAALKRLKKQEKPVSAAKQLLDMQKDCSDPSIFLSMIRAFLATDNQEIWAMAHTLCDKLMDNQEKRDELLAVIAGHQYGPLKKLAVSLCLDLLKSQDVKNTVAVSKSLLAAGNSIEDLNDAEKLIFNDQFWNKCDKEVRKEIEVLFVMRFIEHAHATHDQILTAKACNLFLAHVPYFVDHAAHEKKYIPMVFDLFFEMLERHDAALFFKDYFRRFVKGLTGQEAEDFLQMKTPKVFNIPIEVQINAAMLNQFLDKCVHDELATRSGVAAGGPAIPRREKVWNHLSRFVERCIETKTSKPENRYLLIEKGHLVLKRLVNEFSSDHNAKLVSLVHRFIFVRVPSDVADAHWKVMPAIHSVYKVADQKLNWSAHKAVKAEMDLFVNLLPTLSDTTERGFVDFYEVLDPLLVKLLETRCPHMVSRAISIINHMQMIVPERLLFGFSYTKYTEILSALPNLSHFHVVSVKQASGERINRQENVFDHLRDTMLSSDLFIKIRKNKNAQSIFMSLVETYVCTGLNIAKARIKEQVSVDLLACVAPILRVVLLCGGYNGQHDKYFLHVQELTTILLERVRDTKSWKEHQHASPWMLLNIEECDEIEKAVKVSLSRIDYENRLKIFSHWILGILCLDVNPFITHAAEKMQSALSKGWYAANPECIKIRKRITERLVEGVESTYETEHRHPISAAFLGVVLELFFTDLQESKKPHEFKRCVALVDFFIKQMMYYKSLCLNEHNQIREITAEKAQEDEKELEKKITHCSEEFVRLFRSHHAKKAIDHARRLCHKGILLDVAMNDASLVAKVKQINAIRPVALEELPFESAGYDLSLCMPVEEVNFLEQIYDQCLAYATTARVTIWNRFLREACEFDSANVSLAKTLFHKARTEWNWYQFSGECVKARNEMLGFLVKKSK